MFFREQHRIFSRTPEFVFILIFLVFNEMFTIKWLFFFIKCDIIIRIYGFLRGESFVRIRQGG